MSTPLYVGGALQPGASIIAGKYRLLQKLGEGGMGSVWRAEHIQLQSQIAIKLIDPSLANTTDALSRFLREARSAASLRSPHVVQILDHGVDDGTPYIAMELLDGETLGQRLARIGPLAPADTARLLLQVGRAVRRAHDSGIVHRDLKPDNIFIVQNDDDEVAKVLDFGIAKFNRGDPGSPSTGATRTGALLGTPYYMSPEQVEADRSLDYRSDIWALGVIAFECLLGRRPFDAESLGSLILAICSRPLPIPSASGPVPVGFDAWFARACSREPEGRFPSVREACSELKELCNRVLDVTPGHADLRPPLPTREDSSDTESRVSSKSLAAVSSSQPSPPRAQLVGKRPLLFVGLALFIVCTVFGLLMSRSGSPARAPLTSTPAAHAQSSLATSVATAPIATVSNTSTRQIASSASTRSP